MLRRITALTGVILDITIESRASSALPIRGFVVIGPGSGTHVAEEDVLGRLDHDARMSSPNYQVAALRLLDSLEAFDACVKVRGGRIGVREPSSLVNGMNQMRAVGFRISANSGIERGSNY